jgi:hypothetical protein
MVMVGVIFRVVQSRRSAGEDSVLGWDSNGCSDSKALGDARSSGTLAQNGMGVAVCLTTGGRLFLISERIVAVC